MRRLTLVGILLAGAMTLAACKLDDTGAAQQSEKGGVPQGGVQMDGPDGTSGPRPTIDPTTQATFQDLNRLSIGMLYLQESSHPLTKEQAVTLLPYWQNIQTAMQPPEGQGDQPPAGGWTPGPPKAGDQGQGGMRRGFMMSFDAAKVAGELASVKAALTQEQVSDINALTQDQMNATLQKVGINAGFVVSGGRGPGPDGAVTVIAKGSMPPPSTPGAGEPPMDQARPGPGQGARGNPVIEEVIRMLQALAGK